MSIARATLLAVALAALGSAGGGDDEPKSDEDKAARARQ